MASCLLPLEPVRSRTKTFSPARGQWGQVVVVSVWSHLKDRVAAGAAALPGPVPSAETLVALPIPPEAWRFPLIAPGKGRVEAHCCCLAPPV